MTKVIKQFALSKYSSRQTKASNKEDSVFNLRQSVFVYMQHLVPNHRKAISAWVHTQASATLYALHMTYALASTRM